MSGLTAIVATLFGLIGLIATCFRAYRGQVERAFQTEVCAVLWFILAAVLLK